MIDIDTKYSNMISHILSNGSRKENRTGVDTISAFGVHYDHDMRDGFPLLTTKAINWDHIIIENLWFLSGSRNIELLRHYGVKFWDAWADDKGNVPGPYGNYHRNFPAERTLVTVAPRTRTKPNAQNILMRHFPRVVSSSKFADEVFTSNGCGPYCIIADTGRDEYNRSLHSIQFEHTGYVIENVRMDVIRNGSVRDPYYPTVCGVGHIGDVKVETDVERDLRKVWQHMIERCYDSKCKEYKWYGDKGVFVDDRWLSFSNFYRDAHLLPGWIDKRQDLKSRQLDKDYYGSNCYSKDTCVWTTKSDNVSYRANAFEVTCPYGYAFIDTSRAEVADRFDLSTSCIDDVLNGKQSSTKGYTFKFVNDGNLYRYPFPNDQIRWVTDTLIRDPMSRRMVVSAWEPSEAQKSKLPPCHVLFALNVQNRRYEIGDRIVHCGLKGSVVDRDDSGVHFILDGSEASRNSPMYRSDASLDNVRTLNLHLTQRSCDMALGVPYNLAGYAFLLSLFARFGKLTPGVFSHTLVDAHVYTSKPDGSMAEYDHVPGLREQMARVPRALPRLNIDASVQTLDDVERIIKDRPPIEELRRLFALEGYDPHPAIKFKVAV